MIRLKSFFLATRNQGTKSQKSRQKIDTCDTQNAVIASILATQQEASNNLGMLVAFCTYGPGRIPQAVKKQAMVMSVQM